MRKIPKNYEIRNYLTQIKNEEVEGKKYLYGFIPYNKRSVDMGFSEMIAPSAFNKSIKEANIIALIDHDSSKVLGSSKNKTLEFENKEDGLYIKCEIPNTSYANDAYEIITRGDVNTMSFGFLPVIVDIVGGVDILREVKLYEVSFMVSFPAYEDTTSLALTRTRFVKERRDIDLEKLGEILTKDKIEAEEEVKVVSDIMDKLAKAINLETIYIEEEKKEEKEQIPKAENVEPDKEDTQLKALEEIVELENILI